MHEFSDLHNNFFIFRWKLFDYIHLLFKFCWQYCIFIAYIFIDIEFTLDNLFIYRICHIKFTTSCSKKTNMFLISNKIDCID